MSRRFDVLDCVAAEERLEALIDGELSAGDRHRVEEHLRSCAECRAGRELALEVKSELRALPELDTPPAVIQRVLDAARLERRQRNLPWWRTWRPSPVWALAAAALVLAVLLPLGGGPEDRQTAVTEVDAAAIERATDEARFALAYLSRASRRAGLELRDGVIVDRLVVPAAQGLISVLPRRPEEERRDDEI